MRDICDYLSGRSDKTFLGSGNIGLVVQPAKARVVFVQRWHEGGLCDWAAGSVRSWAPDQIVLNEPQSPVGMRCSVRPFTRQVLVTRDDVVGMTLDWQNDTAESLEVEVTFSGQLPGTIRRGEKAESVVLYAITPYSDQVPQPLHFALAASLPPQQATWHSETYELVFRLTIEPGATSQLTLLLGIGLNLPDIETSLRRWTQTADLHTAVRHDWNRWFDQAIPQFQCSDPYFEKLYYYRWWSLYTKMIFARVGHFLYPVPREGTIAFDGCVSYSGACISVDELRWMRDPAWAFSTTQTFFAPENLNDGYLANHIWAWGIDGDESNEDRLGRAVPYHNYAVAAFYGALLVHPREGQQTLAQIWPQLCSHLASYSHLFDIDQDGLYETYPWSNSAGQEWAARYLYFDPIPEILRYERGRTYAPDGSRTAEDMELVQKIRESVVTDPDIVWPETAVQLYRLYYGTQDHRLATVDQSTYAYANFRAAAHLAHLLNETAVAQRYTQLAEQTRQEICAVMWHPEDAFFYDVRPISHQHARVKSVTGFYVFWAKIAGEKHLPMLHHLFNRATFWASYPLPSLPFDYEKYGALQAAGWTYWNYATWPRTTCHAIDGVLWAAKTLDPSLTTQAVELLNRYTHMHFTDGDINRPTIAERYDPHTAVPFFAELDYNHSTWIDLIIQHIAGLTPHDGDELIIDPVDMGWETFSLRHIHYRDHDIDIEYHRDQGLLVYINCKLKAKTSALKKLIVSL